MRVPGDGRTRWITAEEAEMKMDGQAGGCTWPFSSSVGPETQATGGLRW